MEKIFEYESNYHTHITKQGYEGCNLWKVTVDVELGRHEYDVVFFLRKIWDVDAQCERQWEELCPEERKELEKSLQRRADDCYEELALEHEISVRAARYDSWKDGGH